MSRESGQMQAGKIQQGDAPIRSIFRYPGFYFNAIFRPSTERFGEAGEFATWRLVLLNLIALLLIPVLLGVIRGLVKDNSTGVNVNSSANIFFTALSVLTVGASILAFLFKLIVVPLLFFIGTGIQYLVARLLQGSGRYVSHAFGILLYQVPLALIGGLIILVFVLLHFSTLFFSPLISTALFVYGFFLNIVMIRGVHHLNARRALIAVVVPYVLGIIATISITIAITRYLVDALH